VAFPGARKIAIRGYRSVDAAHLAALLRGRVEHLSVPAELRVQTLSVRLPPASRAHRPHRPRLGLGQLARRAARDVVHLPLVALRLNSPKRTALGADSWSLPVHSQ
jgi:hypothetical protein